MPLPDNAVENAVGKLDGIADELMKKSGIPGMAVAVVHGGKTVYAKGFGVRDVNAGDDARSIRTPCSSWRRCPSRSARPWWRTRSARTRSAGTPRSSTKLPWFALSDPAVTQMVTVGDMFSHRSGLPDHAGDMLEDLGYDRRYVLERLRQLPLDPFRISYAYTNFGLTAGAEAVAASAGKSWEDLAERGAVRPAGDGVDELPVRRLRGPAEPRDRPHPRRRHVRAAVHARPGARGAGGRCELVGERHDPLAGDDAGQRQLRRAADRRPQGAAARAHPADRVQPAERAGDAVGLLRLRLQRGTDVGGRARSSATPGPSNSGPGRTSSSCPSADVAIIALTNGTASGVPEALTAQFADLVQFGEVREDWFNALRNAFADMEQARRLAGRQGAAREPGPAPRLPSYVGTYNNDYWGPATGHREGRQAATRRWVRSWHCAADAIGTVTSSPSLGQRELAAGNDFQGDVRRRQADARVLRRRKGTFVR